MNYENGLEQLKQLVQTGNNEEALSEFKTYEARLLENLKDERLFGTSEQIRADCARVVSALNRLAHIYYGKSFNDLCQVQRKNGIQEQQGIHLVHDLQPEKRRNTKKG